MHLGRAPNPLTDKLEVDPTVAQFNIDLLEILREKTRGNLDDNEERILEEILHVARMSFLEVKKSTGETQEET